MRTARSFYAFLEEVKYIMGNATDKARDCIDTNKLLASSEQEVQSNRSSPLEGDFIEYCADSTQMTEYTLFPERCNMDTFNAIRDLTNELLKDSLKKYLGKSMLVLKYAGKIDNIISAGNPYTQDNVYFVPNILKIFLFERIRYRKIFFCQDGNTHNRLGAFLHSGDVLILEDEKRVVRADALHIEIADTAPGKTTRFPDIIERAELISGYFNNDREALNFCRAFVSQHQIDIRSGALSLPNAFGLPNRYTRSFPISTIDEYKDNIDRRFTNILRSSTQDTGSKEYEFNKRLGRFDSQGLNNSYSI